MPDKVLIYSRFPKAMMARIGQRFELMDAAYREAAQAARDVPYRAERPFPVEIVPSHLVAKLRSQ